MTVTETHEQPVTALRSGDLLGVRNRIYQQVKNHRNKRNFLNEHNHKIEAMVEHTIQEELERAMWEVEKLLDMCKIKYTYGEQ